MSTFGLIVPSRAVSNIDNCVSWVVFKIYLLFFFDEQVDIGFQQVESNKFLITIPNAESINHVVVFLTGSIQLPLGTAGCIFFSLPDPNAPPTWHYLGYLTNEKPSAIYKLTNLTQAHLRDKKEQQQKQQPGIAGPHSGLVFSYIQEPVIHVAQIGISIETIDSVNQMVPAIETAASNVTLFTEFMNKTVGNLFNYCSSFSRTASELMSNPFHAGSLNTVQYVPLSTIQTWYENYTRRLSNDQNFWRSLG